ncbi:MAG TPA: phosphatase PAP2 family protein [Casimicrobiaceae bacterium]|nr:phosphatase PAP2 family protein [Casimicrobiaceae bacterium]
MPPDAARSLQLASSLGENALLAFGGVLFVVLLIVALGWFVVHRRSTSNQTAARASSVTLAPAIAAILAAALLFAMLPGWMVDDGWLSLADDALTAAIRRSVAPPVLQLFAAITVLANTSMLWMIAIGGALLFLWRRDYLLAWIWLVAIGGNGVLTRVLKDLFARQRPRFEHDLITAQGWSFPSGHSSGAIVAYGMLAYVLIRRTPSTWHLPIVLLATTIAYITGCSRIFLQVHHASDVLAGFASGLAWLAICVTAAELIQRR